MSTVYLESAAPPRKPRPVRPPTVGEAEPVRYTAEDVLALAWRERRVAAAVFGALLLVLTVLIFAAPPSYEAHSSLMIRLGRSYVYQPAVGDAGRGAAPDNDQVVQSELEILQSDPVRLRVVRDVGLKRLLPGVSDADLRDPRRAETLATRAAASIGTRLKVSSAPDAAVARLSFTDRDPELAATILNTLVDEYLRYRRQVLNDNLQPLDAQRRALQSQLEGADAALQDFLKSNGVGDFEAEKTSLTQIYSGLMTDRYSVAAQIAEVSGRLAATRGELARSTPEIGLFQDLDHTAQDKLAQARVDLADLLSRYQSNAQPVRDLQQKIRGLEAAAAASAGGARRIGANPVYQTLQTEKNQLEAQLASLRDRDAELGREIAQVLQRRQTLTALEPRFEALQRQRDLVGASLKSVAEREEQSEAAQRLDQAGADDGVRVVERAYPSPRRGGRALLLALAAAASAAAALALALTRGFLAPGFPTRSAAERVLGLPVLAAVTP